MANKNLFKHPSILHRTKSDKPMRYYILNEEDIHETKTMQAVCLARPELSDNPYRQCWYIEEESSMVIRQSRNEKGENFARDNMHFIWREQTYQERKYAGVWKAILKTYFFIRAPPTSSSFDSPQKTDWRQDNEILAERPQLQEIQEL